MCSNVGRDTAGTMAALINQSSHSKSRLGLPCAQYTSGIESLAGCRSQRIRSVRSAYGKGDDGSPASIALVAWRADEALLSTSAGSRLDDDATALANLVHDQIVRPS
jgi:hypothetical protein